MKKYLLALLTALLFAAILSGCTSKSNSQGSSVSEETASTVEEETIDNEAPAEEEADDDIFSLYYGTWEVKDYAAAEISTMSADELETFRGKTVTYQADSILLDGQDAGAGSFTYEVADSAYDYDELTEEYQVNLGEWWNNISEVTKVTVVSDTDFFGSQIFLADADTLWIYQDGVCFLARRK